jgi:hypothetical protein
MSTLASIDEDDCTQYVAIGARALVQQFESGSIQFRCRKRFAPDA